MIGESGIPVDPSRAMAQTQRGGGGGQNAKKKTRMTGKGRRTKGNIQVPIATDGERCRREPATDAPNPPFLITPPPLVKGKQTAGGSIDEKWLKNPPGGGRCEIEGNGEEMTR